MKHGYFEVYVKDGCQGFSTFFDAEFPNTPKTADVVRKAVELKLIEQDDVEFVSYAQEIPESEYVEATK